MRWSALLLTLGLLPFITPELAAQPAEPDRKIRNVTPDNIPVIILPPRKQDATKPEDNSPVPGDGITAHLTESGLILSDGRALAFAGIKPVPNDALCEAGNGGRWACGLRAFVALRNFVHGKEIKCEALQTREAATSRCFRERTNISEWMVGEGWALYDESARDETLSRLAEDARKNARGIWANGSRVLDRTER